MAELITIFIDIALGAYAFKLARENRTAIALVRGELAKLRKEFEDYVASRAD